MGLYGFESSSAGVSSSGEVKQYQKELTLSDTAATDIDAFEGGIADKKDIINDLWILNNDTVTQEVIIKLKKYNVSYLTVFEATYSIISGESVLIVEFIDKVLLGDTSNPDKITIQFDVTMTGSDSIQLIGSGIQS